MIKKIVLADKLASLEKQLFSAADKLRKNMDAAEYKHVVLGLIFLKYISDSFEELYNRLKAEEEDTEEKDFYLAENVFFVPENARWNFLKDNAKQTHIKTLVVEAMEQIEKENPILKNILPKEYDRPNLDTKSLGELIDHISKIDLSGGAAKQNDILGKIYEYFLGEFALAEGKKGGQFYTPECVVKLLVEILQPYQGRVFDPCCGSGGMFVQSQKFVKAHQSSNPYKSGKNGKNGESEFTKKVSIYGQESNQTTWNLCRMNLAIRGINGEHVKWNNEGSFFKDEHPDLKADFIIANPPFNDKDWGEEQLANKNDARWAYGLPKGTANFAWVQHFIYHLSTKGKAGFVLSNGSLASESGTDGEIRKAIIEANLVECIVAMPDKMFYNTGIPACLWFLNRNKANTDILFMDIRNMGIMQSSTQRVLTDEEIHNLSAIFKLHKGENTEFLLLVDAYLSHINDLLEEFENHLHTSLNDFKTHVLPLFEEWLTAISTKISDKQKQQTKKFDFDKKIETFKVNFNSYLENARMQLSTLTTDWTQAFIALRDTEFENAAAKNNYQHAIAAKIEPNNQRIKNLFEQLKTLYAEYESNLNFCKTELSTEKLKPIWQKYGLLMQHNKTKEVFELMNVCANNMQYYSENIQFLQNNFPEAVYADRKGFCKRAEATEVQNYGYVLTPGRYVGIADVEDDPTAFTEKMKQLSAELLQQLNDAAVLDQKLRNNLNLLELW